VPSAQFLSFTGAVNCLEIYVRIVGKSEIPIGSARDVNALCLLCDFKCLQFCVFWFTDNAACRATTRVTHTHTLRHSSTHSALFLVKRFKRNTTTASNRRRTPMDRRWIKWMNKIKTSTQDRGSDVARRQGDISLLFIAIFLFCIYQFNLFFFLDSTRFVFWCFCGQFVEWGICSRCMGVDESSQRTQHLTHLRERAWATRCTRHP
jgi:hypothetical protein